MKSLNDIADETARAREKHGRSFELGNDDKKLRRLMEEVGEVAEALEDIECTETRRYAGSKVERTPWLEGARESVIDARADLRTELVQVASLAIRWINQIDGVDS